MAKVQLKENLIFGGEFHRFDKVIDEEALPAKFRTPQYVKPPEPPEEEDEPINVSDGPDLWEDGPPPTTPPRKR